MTTEITPSAGLFSGFADKENGWGSQVNANWLTLELLSVPIVTSAVVSTPPASPASGDRYIIPANATDSWLGKDNQIALYMRSTWYYFPAKKGWLFRSLSESKTYQFDGTVWKQYFESLSQDTMQKINAAIDAGQTATAAALQASTSKNDAVAAKSGAEAARDSSVQAATLSTTNKNDTQAARDVAIQAKIDAVSARDSASTSERVAVYASQTIQTDLAGKVDKVTMAGNNDLNSITETGFYRVGYYNANLIYPYSQVIVSRGEDTVAQMSIHYDIGTMAVRGAHIVSGVGNWTPWRTLLADHNFNSYAPTLTGVGASGSWDINVKGYALGTAVADIGRDAGIIYPNGFAHSARYEFVTGASAGNPGSSYSGVMTFTPYDGHTASTGGNSYQLAFGSNASYGTTPDLKIRNGADTTWNNWYTLWHSGNLLLSSIGEPGTVVKLDSGGGLATSNVWMTQTTGEGNGIHLYPSKTGNIPTYGILFAKQQLYGNHNSVNSDFATYLTMDGSAGRGWIFRNVATGNVASIDNQGNASFNGIVIAANLSPNAQSRSLDAIKPTGLYHYDGGISGTTPPDNSLNYRTIEIGADGRYSQIAMPFDADSMYFRRQIGGVWSPWNEVFHTGNLGKYVEAGNFASGSVNINASVAGHQKITASGNFTLTLSGFRPSGTTDELLLECVNFGGKTIAFPTINWVKSDGSFTTAFASNGVTLQSSGTDFIRIWTHDGGATLYGKVMR